MTQLHLFDDPEPQPLPPQASRLAPRLRALADRHVYFGTSSWKYPGWLGSIYRPERYQVRNKFSQRKFEAECLREYAETFPVVGGDFSFYQFPSPQYWERLFGETPDSLLFGLKVPENLTVAIWPRHARYGARAGQLNQEFLDPTVLDRLFLRPLLPYRDRLAVLMFEFGHLSHEVIDTPATFIGLIEAFLAGLPEGFRFAVEIRNPEFLGEPYFKALASHNVAHVFNAWTRMPDLETQIELPGAFTADFTVARALLKHGQAYDDAVDRFEPYTRVQEPNPATRKALRTLASNALANRRPAFLFVNNRLEGNAPGTIEAVTEELDI